MSALGGSDWASLVLRVSVGGTLIAHGVKHGRSLGGTSRWFGSVGFRRPGLQALLSAAVEIAAGGALVLGVTTPLAASAVIGTMAVAAVTVHRRNGFFITAEGYEYVLALSCAAAATAALGGGRFSIDHLAGIDSRLSGISLALAAVLLGVVGAAAQLAIFWRPNEIGSATDA